MKMNKTVFVAICLLALAAPQVSHAVITFTQLADNIFVVSHRVKFIGSRSQAMKLVYTKAASLCIAAGYSYMEIVDQDSEAAQEDDSANASVRVKYYMGPGEDRLNCDKNADHEYIGQAGAKLLAQGYRPPDPEEMAAAVESDGTSTGKCSIEQIVAMVHAGLEIDQIKAACPQE
jgi:hypothetical protein